MPYIIAYSSEEFRVVSELVLEVIESLFQLEMR
jgi:hypothetical protein